MLDELNEEDLGRVLTKPKNSLIKQYQELLSYNVTLRFTEGAAQTIASKAIKRKTGARGLRAITEEALLETMFDIPGREDVKEVIISEKVFSNARVLYWSIPIMLRLGRKLARIDIFCKSLG